MTVPDPEHFLDQEEQLLGPTSSRSQVDFRRAVSSAYYAVFHAALTAAADSAVGRSARTSPRYWLAYRSIDHRSFRELCKEILKPSPATKYREYIPLGGFGPDVRAFAKEVVELQLRREEADYDPLKSFKRSDALLAIKAGRTALRRLEIVPRPEREAFIALLLFPPRS